MTQRLRFQLSDITVEEESENLKKLLENYINRSEELERKESHVIKQVELLQSVLASLQAWNKEKEIKTTGTVRLSVDEIEEETQKIREETERIQKEVREKIESNKKLQDEISRRKTLETGTIDEFVTDSFLRNMEEETQRQKLAREELESRALASVSEELPEDPGLQLFRQKLKKLREMEKKLKRESEEEGKEAQKKRRELKEKIEMLEWESEVDRKLLKNLKQKFKDN